MTDYSYETFQPMEPLGPYFSLLIFVILTLSMLALYFLPSIIAMMRQHPQKWLLAGLNVFAGWTGVFWIGLLVWALWPKDKLLSITRHSAGAAQDWGPYQAYDRSQSFGRADRQSRPEDTLTQLASMKERGLLTEEEFAKAKEKLINRL